MRHCIKIHSYFFQDHFGSFKTIFLFSIFTAQWQDSSFSSRPHSTGPLRTSRQPSRSGSHVTLTLEASNIPRERWYASIVGFLGTEGFKRWQHLNISKDVEKRKTPEDIFTAFAKTLEVLMSQWNYIDEMYSDICQGEQETTDQLDQCIKILVEKCGYPTNEEKERC